MKRKLFLPMMSLQHFAEGGAAAGGNGTAQGAGVSGNDAGSQTTGAANPTVPAAGVQQQAAAQQPDRKAEFEKLIRGDYKDQFNERVQNIVTSRLKGNQQTVDAYKALQPVLDMLGAKYGIQDLTDAKAILKALEEDDTFFEEEATKRGLTVQQYKDFRKIERENAEFQRQNQERQRKERADQIYAEWARQSEDLKETYPSFDLNAELKNETFGVLLRNGFTVRNAYQAVHADEIISGAMKFTAQKVQQATVASIASGQGRPTENGNAGQSAASTTSDVSKLSKTQRQDMIRRAAAGEKITFR